MRSLNPSDLGVDKYPVSAFPDCMTCSVSYYFTVDPQQRTCSISRPLDSVTHRLCAGLHARVVCLGQCYRQFSQNRSVFLMYERLNWQVRIAHVYTCGDNISFLDPLMPSLYPPPHCHRFKASKPELSLSPTHLTRQIAHWLSINIPNFHPLQTLIILCKYCL